jgi:insertion element IS1 protein InsB
MKREAVSLYCAGLSLSAVGKRLGVSAQSVMRWVRDHARRHCPKPEPAGRATVVEIDEVWHFVQKRPASSGSGRPRARHGPPDRLGSAATATGSRSSACWPAWSPGACGLFCTDDWAPYDAALPAGRHYIGKDQTQRSESNNARQRHWFARFRRRTCVVSRSVAMVEATMALFAFYHCNGGSLTPALIA